MVGFSAATLMLGSIHNNTFPPSTASRRYTCEGDGIFNSNLKQNGGFYVCLALSPELLRLRIRERALVKLVWERIRVILIITQNELTTPNGMAF